MKKLFVEIIKVAVMFYGGCLIWHITWWGIVPILLWIIFYLAPYSVIYMTLYTLRNLYSGQGLVYALSQTLYPLFWVVIGTILSHAVRK